MVVEGITRSEVASHSGARRMLKSEGTASRKSGPVGSNRLMICDPDSNPKSEPELKYIYQAFAFVDLRSTPIHRAAERARELIPNG